MKLIHSLFGRRQFLITFVFSTLAMAFGRVANAFDLIFKEKVAKASEKPGTAEKRPHRAIVIYYSGSGNTAKIAGALHRGIKSLIPCDISPVAPALMKKVKPADMSKYDLVAIGSCNWFMREVANVKIFTHDMPQMEGKHCILFATHGTQPFGQFWSMSQNVLKKGMTIIGWNDWFGPQILPEGDTVFVHPATGHPDAIDLAEAEAFGREMAENSIRIYAGEKALIPEIPRPEKGVASNWSPRADALGNFRFAEPPPNSYPIFDFTKCVYPRCTQCIDNCPVRAIDMSMISPVSPVDLSASTASPLALKEACQHCGGICERVCIYDAIAIKGEKFYHKVDMTKCTYPKCTACMDWCAQSCIDFAVNPPVFHNHCETCNICFGVCPTNAVIITNPEHKGQWWRKPPGQSTETSRTPMMEKAVQAAEGPRGAGPFGAAPMMGGEMHLPRFRPLITQEEQQEEQRRRAAYKDYPRLKFKKEDWPCEMG